MTSPSKCVHLKVAAVGLALLLSAMGGWGKEGHAIIAQIAWDELSPEAKTEIRTLLGDTGLPEIASWADSVRHEPNYKWSAPLHYVNMPADADAYVHERDCPPQGCVVSAIDRFATVLADHDKSPQERGEALMFIVHFVGDVHQPLHGGRAEDRGGNSIEVTFRGEETNLHRVWDYGIIEAASDEPWPEQAKALEHEITEQDRIVWLASETPDNWIATAGRWAFESHRLAEMYAYPVHSGDELGQAYIDHCDPVVNVRLKEAGIRLASVLEACLVDQPKSEDDADATTNAAEAAPRSRASAPQRATSPAGSS